MYNLIIKYLKENGISDFSKFRLYQGTGDIEIKDWGYNIAEYGNLEKPSFTNTQCKISCKKTDLIEPRSLYLKSTDWYTAREVDEPSSYPVEIKNKRILAREEINSIEACTTLAALNEFSVNFE